MTSPNSQVDLSQLLTELARVAETPFEHARPVPAAVNHSEAFFQHEQRAVFQHEWICVGRADELAKPGDYLTHKIANVPVLVVRQTEGTLAAFVNACAHRFACLVPDAQGNAKRFMCRYHAWTYDLSGALIRAPYMEMQAGFNSSEHGLRALHLSQWEGFVYVTLSEAPRHVPEDALAALREGVVGRYEMACYRTVMRRQMRWPANWKNLIENFTESYHVPFAHQKTFALHKKPLEHYTCGEDADHYCYHTAPQAAETGSGAAHPANTRLSGEWRRMMVDFCVFPNQLVTLMPDFLWWISVQPDGVGAFDATWGVAIPPEVLDDIAPEAFDSWLTDLEAYMNTANDEDKILVEALHQGTASPHLPRGAYHPIERNLWQFTRYLSRICAPLPD